MSVGFMRLKIPSPLSLVVSQTTRIRPRVCFCLPAPLPLNPTRFWPSGAVLPHPSLPPSRNRFPRCPPVALYLLPPESRLVRFLWRRPSHLQSHLPTPSLSLPGKKGSLKSLARKNPAGGHLPERADGPGERRGQGPAAPGPRRQCGSAGCVSPRPLAPPASDPSSTPCT